MNPEDTIGGIELPHDTDMVEFGFVDDSRRLRVEALNAKYEILEAREIKIEEEDD